MLAVSVDPSGLPTTNDRYDSGIVTVSAPGAPPINIPVALATYEGLDGPSGITPYLAETEKVQDAVGFRYKFKVQVNSGNEETLKILLFSRSFYNPNRPEPFGYYEFETNLYSDWWGYKDEGCVEFGGLGVNHPGQTGLWVSIPDYPAVDPSFPLAMKGRIGIRPSDLSAFPRGSYGIDGIPFLTKIETISQQDMTGQDVSVQISRGDTFADDLSNWGYRLDPTRADNLPSACLPNLPSGFTYRKWQVLVSFGTKSYSWDLAMPQDQALYISPDQLIAITTEFFQTSGAFQAFIWDLNGQSEKTMLWQPLTRWGVTYQIHSERNTGSGVKLGTYLGNRVIEFSCDRTDTYSRLYDVLDLATGESGPMPTVSAVQTVGGPGAVAPNAVIHIVGTGLAPHSLEPEGITWLGSPELAANRMPTVLRSVSVAIGGKPAYILYVS
jgi:hypothetical protein